MTFPRVVPVRTTLWGFPLLEGSVPHKRLLPSDPVATSGIADEVALLEVFLRVPRIAEVPHLEDLFFLVVDHAPMHLQTPALPRLVCPNQGILGMRRPRVLGEEDPIASLDQNPIHEELCPVGDVEGRTPGQGVSHNKQQERD